MIAKVAWWREACFRSEPRPVWLARDTRVWRAWSESRIDRDGALVISPRQKAMYGSGFFNPAKPESTIEAEMQGDIVRWGNLVTYLTEFRVIHGLYVYRGLLEHADAPMDRRFEDVEQIYVKDASLEDLRRHFAEIPGGTRSLLATGWVSVRSGHA